MTYLVFNLFVLKSQMFFGYCVTRLVVHEIPNEIPNDKFFIRTTDAIGFVYHKVCTVIIHCV